MPRPTRPKRGEIVEVTWLDITEESTGDPKTAAVSKRKSVGRFWGWRNQDGRRILVTTTTEDPPEVEHQSGYCAYPWRCVLGLRIVERKGK